MKIQKTQIRHFDSILALAKSLFEAGRINIEKKTFDVKESFSPCENLNEEDRERSLDDLIELIENFAYQQISDEDDDALFDAPTFVFECIAAMCILDGSISVDVLGNTQ